mgnify:CR=1 FL=1
MVGYYRVSTVIMGLEGYMWLVRGLKYMGGQYEGLNDKVP